MTVKIIEPRHMSEALDTLTSLSQEFPKTEYIFRGQQDSQWPLCTSYDRYWAGRPIYDDSFVTKMIAQFRSGIARLGLRTSLGNNQLAWLEYARHHGLPAPLLDFSWSPFVALFFAFDGVRERQDSRNAAVYALNLNQLAHEMVRRKVGDSNDPNVRVRAYRDFVYGGASQFTAEFPMEELILIRSPSVHTRRMHAQLGAFLYCTITLGSGPGEPSNLDEFLDTIQEGYDSPHLPKDIRPVLIKMVLPHTWASEVFSRLEVMSISGSTMFLSADGVAKDIYNSYYYEPRAAFLRDFE